MTLVMTLMVRDEADIIAAMIEHHLAQGIDVLLVTDNGSVDGTREILSAYEEHGVVRVFDDFEHRKQQHSVVTAMARRAFTEYAATWVLNADADEFWVARDRTMTLRQAFGAIPVEVGSFLVPVHNMTGPPARSGSGLRRLRWRDERTTGGIAAAGILAHPTPDAVHVGDPTVTVAQGNHAVSIASNAPEGEDFGIEVLHYPWRSWAQFQRKVTNAGLGYDANPDLNPSPNHHGMRDYRRHQEGTLLPFYLLRHATTDQLADPSGELVRDDSLIERLESVLENATEPELLRRSLDDSDDDRYDAGQQVDYAKFANAVITLENDRDERLGAARDLLSAHEREAAVLRQSLAEQEEEARTASGVLAEVLNTAEYRHGVRLMRAARRLRLDSLVRAYRRVRYRRG